MKAIKTVLLLSLIAAAVAQDEEEEEMMMFSQHLANFTPEESFEFELDAGEQQTFIYWPLPTEKSLKGLFYITS